MSSPASSALVLLDFDSPISLNLEHLVRLHAHCSMRLRCALAETAAVSALVSFYHRFIAHRPSPIAPPIVEVTWGIVDEHPAIC